jgi:hypothetical protein
VVTHRWCRPRGGRPRPTFARIERSTFRPFRVFRSRSPRPAPAWLAIGRVLSVLFVDRLERGRICGTGPTTAALPRAPPVSGWPRCMTSTLMVSISSSDDRPIARLAGKDEPSNLLCGNMIRRRAESGARSGASADCLACSDRSTVCIVTGFVSSALAVRRPVAAVLVLAQRGEGTLLGRVRRLRQCRVFRHRVCE